jgi:hypothetical protein
VDSGTIGGIIGGIVSIILCGYVSSRISHKSNDGQLKFGLIISCLFWMCLLIVGACFFGLFFTDINLERDLYPIVGLIVGFGLGAIYSYGEAFKVHGKFDEKSIQFHTPWSGSKDELWANLKQVKFHATPNWYTLTFESGAKIRLSALLSGHGLVIDHVKSLGHDL